MFAEAEEAVSSMQIIAILVIAAFNAVEPLPFKVLAFLDQA
jgi:hypothetical protein